MPAADRPPAATVLTVNRRLARFLRERHAAAQAARGRLAWETPDILPLDAWLARCWEAHAAVAPDPQPHVLSPEQEQVVWEQVLRGERSPQGALPLLQVRRAARSAREAYALLGDYRCGLAGLEAAGNADTDAFLRWCRRFEARRRREGWIEPGALAARLAGLARRGALELPPHVRLAGFDELPPARRELVEALRAAGVEVTEQSPEAAAGCAGRLAFDEPRQEIVAAARWARARIEAGAGGPVGVVVPDLAARRAEVTRVFDEVLRPAAVLPGAAPGERPFNVSLGVALARVAVIRDALRVLQLACGRLELPALGALLCSPYLAGAEPEHTARARLDAVLREAGAPALSLAALRSRAARGAAGRVPVPRLREALARLAAARRAAPARQHCAAWAAGFAGWLQALGWPGGRTADSGEFQAVEAFRELLGSFADLGGVLGPLAPGEALARLSDLAAERLFQPRSAPAPVQVLGLLECAGLRFSHLWICGLHDAAWPPPPRPHPFLPVALQRRAGMPHATPARELEFARRVTARLLAAADEIVVSHARREGEAELRPSPLIASLPRSEGAAAVAGGSTSLAARWNAARPALEAWTDERGPALAPGASPPGGVAVFRDQAACPFRAFAVHRLGARALEAPAPGLDARVRGTLAHHLLERLWGELGSHARLCAAGPAELRELSARHVEAVLAAAARRRPETLHGRFLALERRRLQALAEAWLELERARPPFTVAEAERQREATLGGMTVRVRLDRVDRLADGRLLLIDYKTGRSATAGWFGERPDEPQLPLYAVTVEQPVAGIAFASLRPGALGLRGLAAEEGLAPGVRRLAAQRRAAGRGAGDWPALLADWRRVLEALAAEFADGAARVDPKAPPRTCAGCDVHPLCRIHELRQPRGTPAEAAAPEPRR